MNRLILRGAAAAGLFALTIGATLAVDSRSRLPQVAEPSVSSIAGDGRDAIRDGSAAEASFMEPAGIAIGRDGRTLIVTDAGANEVRRIVNGTVTTVAGSPSGAAGFLDGPARTALFNRPSGVAIGKDGSLYVADMLNHRIRRIVGNRVETFAGTGAAGGTNGPAATATFNLPKSIAIDDDGNLYVADYGVGLRKITPAGIVSAYQVPVTPMANGIAAAGSGASLIVAYTDNEGIHIVANGVHRGLAFSTEREPYSENNRVGTAFGIAIVDRGSVVITDLMTNAVRYVAFNDPPFQPAPVARTLVGGNRDGELQRGGFHDGGSAEALARVPYGIARSANGTIFFTDSGNRRVREISGLSTRAPIASDLSNLTFPPHTYRIALIGDSYTWNHVLWPESISGFLETALISAQQRMGIPARPHVIVLSASGGTLKSGSEFISNNLGDGQADLVLLVYDKLALSHEFQAEPALTKDDAWKSVLPARASALAAQLAKNGTAFALLMIPVGRDVSPVEQPALREDGGDAASYDFARNYASGIAFEDAFDGKGLHVIHTLAELAREDREPDAPLLFNMRDTHLTIPGDIAIGQATLEDVLRWSPWKTAK